MYSKRYSANEHDCGPSIINTHLVDWSGRRPTPVGSSGQVKQPTVSHCSIKECVCLISASFFVIKYRLPLYGSIYLLSNGVNYFRELALCNLLCIDHTSPFSD